MNTNSNAYIFIYSSVLVIVVAAGLAFTALTLKPAQDLNIEIEKKQNILASFGIPSTPENAVELYSKYVKETYAINAAGEKLDLEPSKVFNTDLKKETVKPIDERVLPLYRAEVDGKTYVIIPLRGKGLWGPIWGYVSLESDLNTIHGAVFDHKGETPGLGAEINRDWFQEPFVGKKLFDASGKFTSIHVYKGGKGASALAGDTDHGVDGISGGTITSKGLEAMLRDCLVAYEKYFVQNKQ